MVNQVAYGLGFFVVIFAVNFEVALDDHFHPRGTVFYLVGSVRISLEKDFVEYLAVGIAVDGDGAAV